MRITSSFLLVSLLVAGNAYADPSVIIRERAKELSNQNNVWQGVASPAEQAQPAVTPNAPAGPTLSPVLLRFNAELAAIKAEAQVTPDQQQKLAQDLVVAAQGVRPSLASAAKLAAKLSAAFGEKPLSATSRARFVQELDAVLNPAKYPQAKLEGIIRDVQAIFQENGLARAKAVAIADGVKTLAMEIQKGRG